MDKIRKLEQLSAWQFDNHEFQSTINYLIEVINMLLEKNGMLEEDKEELE